MSEAVERRFLSHTSCEGNDVQLVGLATANECMLGVLNITKKLSAEFSTLNEIKTNIEDNFPHLVKFCGSPRIS